MKKILIAIGFIVCITHTAQSAPPADGNEAIIRKILSEQTSAWNRGDLVSFMKDYWKNDSLMFIGKSGVTYGWTNTLNNYKKSYPDTATMGKLTFSLIQVKRLSGHYYHVTGKWHLKRSGGDLEGHYTLVFRKIKRHWYIVSDHSS
jgi:ketosteroid isomerase-like protein